MGKESVKLIANNKKAYHDYFIDEKYEAGIELFGTETGEAKEEKIYKLCGMWRKELSFPL